MIVTLQGPNDRRKLILAERIANGLSEKGIKVSIALEPDGLIDVKKLREKGILTKDESPSSMSIIASLNFARACEEWESKTQEDDVTVLIGNADIGMGHVAMFGIFRQKYYVSIPDPERSLSEDDIFKRIWEPLDEKLVSLRHIERS